MTTRGKSRNELEKNNKTLLYFGLQNLRAKLFTDRFIMTPLFHWGSLPLVTVVQPHGS